jgi:hypothetical protein
VSRGNHLAQKIQWGKQDTANVGCHFIGLYFQTYLDIFTERNIVTHLRKYFGHPVLFKFFGTFSSNIIKINERYVSTLK